MVAGSDRTGEYHKLLHQYNGVKGSHGYFKFKGIHVHSAGERDPDSEGVEGMSASKMREHASKGNFKEFKKGVPGHVAHEHAKELYHDVRKGMNIKEDFHSQVQMILSEGVHDKSIFKAVFLSGGPGSGKDYVLDNTLAGHGLVEINSDKALEFLMDKNNLDKKMPASEAEMRTIVRGRAKDITELKQHLALLGRNGLIINGTGDDPEKYAKIKKNLEEIGYETSMVAVVTKDEVSAQRNVERGQRGGRTVPEDIRKQKWDSVNNARPEMAKLFGKNYIEFDNSEDLRSADPEVVKAKKDEMTNIFKKIQEFVKAPPKNEQAKQWVAGELAKKDTLPVSKKGAELSQPHSQEGDNQAADEARRLGLQYFGFGRYGKNNKVTHHSVHGKLVADPTHVEQQKAIKDAAKVKAVASSGSPTPKKSVKESLNDEIQSLFESVSITVTADTVDELNQAFMMLNGKKQEIKVESDDRTMSVMSGIDSMNALTLGKVVPVFESYSGMKTVKQNGNTYIAQGDKPRVYILRNSAAKDAHRNNGEVVKADKGYMVKLKESNDVEIFQKPIIKETTNGETSSGWSNEKSTASEGRSTISEAGTSGSTSTSGGTSSRILTEHCGCEDGSTSGEAKESTSKAKGKIYLSKIKENFKQKINEIDMGIQSGMSMAAGGESIARDMGEYPAKDGKASPLKKKPIKEMGGDETTASIGDQKEDELKKQGITLSSFKKKNYL
jgi:predicted ABC-type ATPase/peroxiredoxin family protein